MRSLACYLFLALLLTSAMSRSLRYLEDINLHLAPGGQLLPADKQAIVRAVDAMRKQCSPSTGNHLVTIQEVVEQDEPRTGIAKTEAVSAFVASLGVAGWSVEQGQISRTDVRFQSRKEASGQPAPLTGTIEIRMMCTSDQ